MIEYKLYEREGNSYCTYNADNIILAIGKYIAAGGNIKDITKIESKYIKKN